MQIFDPFLSKKIEFFLMCKACFRKSLETWPVRKGTQSRILAEECLFFAVSSFRNNVSFQIKGEYKL